MDDNNKLYKERDEFIKKTLQADKIIAAPVLDTFETHIESSKIKVKKYTYKQKKSFLFLIFLLCISVGYNFYLINIKNPSIELEQTSQISSTEAKPNIKKENTIETHHSKNTVSDKQDTSVLENTTISNTIESEVITEITPVEKTLENSNTVNVENLKNFLEMYSLGINRITYEENNLESNTILLMIAKKYFSSIPSKDISADLRKNYTFITNNINVFIKEITGKSFVNNIQTYSNYINYSPGAKSYIYGKDSENLTKEKYYCKEVEILDFKDNVYTAKAIIERTVDNEKTNYEINLQFKLNSEYLYSQFQIINLNAKNISFYPDNTLHLVDIDTSIN